MGLDELGFVERLDYRRRKLSGDGTEKTRSGRFVVWFHPFKKRPFALYDRRRKLLVVGPVIAKSVD